MDFIRSSFCLYGGAPLELRMTCIAAAPCGRRSVGQFSDALRAARDRQRLKAERRAALGQ